MNYKVEKIRPKYSDSELKKFDDYNQFMEASVELLKQTVELL